MDFGATICKPKNPICLDCVMQKNCIAYNQQLVDVLPLKSKKLIKKQRWFFYITAKYKNQYYVRNRTAKDIWQNLHEFILIEKSGHSSADTIINSAEWKKVIDVPFELLEVSNPINQQLTHQTITGTFITIQLKAPLQTNMYAPITKKQIQQLAFPKIISSNLNWLINL
jgi:A/G-specific adenine glycosylase